MKKNPVKHPVAVQTAPSAAEWVQVPQLAGHITQLTALEESTTAAATQVAQAVAELQVAQLVPQAVQAAVAR